jgi:hypothetical protein
VCIPNVRANLIKTYTGSAWKLEQRSKVVEKMVSTGLEEVVDDLHIERLNTNWTSWCERERVFEPGFSSTSTFRAMVRATDIMIANRGGRRRVPSHPK